MCHEAEVSAPALRGFAKAPMMSEEVNSAGDMQVQASGGLSVLRQQAQIELAEAAADAAEAETLAAQELRRADVATKEAKALSQALAQSSPEELAQALQAGDRTRHARVCASAEAEAGAGDEAGAAGAVTASAVGRSGLMGSMMSGMATGTGFSLGNRAAEAVFGPRQAEATWRAALVGEGFELLEGTGEKRKAVPAVPDLHLK
ncbi:unnamed protein product [Effrenium voratum]|uniref:Uncharacterized protein n=1 Tax=Effrenium voratum TaxID=2562239 RepID=A0AA36J7H6_9DINO|nr:unnamed protein product [Effrenium voratum]